MKKNFLLSLYINLTVRFLFLMNNTHYTKEQARAFLKQEVMKEISKGPDFTRFHTRAFCVVAKYGLQLEAKKEGLLSGDEWNDPPSKNILLNRIERFFDTHIQ